MKLVPEALQRLIGRRLVDIDTPALVVDLDALSRNVQRMAEFASRHRLRWRPHAKTHKSCEIALFQMQAGAIGICVQKTSEAEIMAEGGIRDIYISNQVVGPEKLQRVARLAMQLAAERGRLAIAVDHAEGVTRLAQALREAGAGPNTLDVLVEIDVGQTRCGVVPGAPAVALAKAVMEHPAMRFAGVQAYHGKAQHLRTPAQRREAIAGEARAVQSTLGWMAQAGIPVPLVTGAGTGSFALEAASGLYGELQTGSFLFMDVDYAANERDPAQPVFEHALFVQAQVMSAARDHVVCDAGHKAHAIDSGFPHVHAPAEHRSLIYLNGGDEHGILHRPNRDTPLPALGETVWLIPGHCDPTVNLHDWMIGVRGGIPGGVVERAISVDARGALT